MSIIVGIPIDESPPDSLNMQNGYHVADDRRDLETRLSTLHTILRQFEDLGAQREAVYARNSNLFRSPAKPWSKGMWWLWFFALGTGTFLAWGLLVQPIVRMLPGNGITVPAVLYTIGIFLAPPIAAIVGANLAKRNYINRGLPKKNAEIRKANDETRARITRDAAPELEQIEARIQSARGAYKSQGFPGFFPDRYLNSNDVGQCWRYVRDHRAVSVQQAINLLEEELHRARMENAQAAQLAEQQRTRRNVQVGNIINAIGHIQTQQTIRDWR